MEPAAAPAADRRLPVRSGLRQPGRMTDSTAARLFRKKPLRSYRGRSETYSWLRAHHGEVAAALAGEELTWARLVADMTLDGVAGRAGAPLTANAALRVWQRVKRDVAASLAAEAARMRPMFPSRLPPDWRPQPVQPPPPIRPPPPAAAPAHPGPRPPREDGIVMTPKAQAELDRAMEALEALDRDRFWFRK